MKIWRWFLSFLFNMSRGEMNLSSKSASGGFKMWFLSVWGFFVVFSPLNEDINEEDYIVFRETEEVQLFAKANIRRLV